MKFLRFQLTTNSSRFPERAYREREAHIRGPEPEAYEPNEGFQDVPRMMYGHLTTRLTPLPPRGGFCKGCPEKSLLF